jgi:7,8-dihydro-6-hydroxymethylpterin-pyrophosphokinase
MGVYEEYVEPAQRWLDLDIIPYGDRTIAQQKELDRLNVYLDELEEIPYERMVAAIDEKEEGK